MSAAAATTAAEVSLPGQRSAGRRLLSVPAQARESARPAAVGKFAPCCGVLPRLFVPGPFQKIDTTRGRVASDGYSWMQAVHWVDGTGCYTPLVAGTPQFGRTTVRLAQLLAELSPCRPGVQYLMRRLGASERTVQYHLQLLREAGLLVYIVKGTRVRGHRPQASEFALVIPAEFDVALGIRTAGDGAGRRMTGIAEAGRELMARLARKASRKVRAPRSRSVREAAKAAAATALEAAAGVSQTGLSQVSREDSGVDFDHTDCTPMEGGTCACLPAALTRLPSESELASGEQDHPTPKTQQAAAPARKAVRKLNAVGRRHQLARELVEQVPWMTRAAVPRIAWIVRHVSDAGWTADQVIAWLEVAGACGQVRRPSAYLAHRLRGAHLLWDSEAKRANGVAAWRDSRRSSADRHVEWDGDWKKPASVYVHGLVDAAKRKLAVGREEFGTTSHREDDPVGNPLGLPWEEIVDLRAAGEKDHGLVRNALEAWGEDLARQVYSDRIVDLAQTADRAAARSFRMVVHATPWEGR